jgi:hypothetical protein
MRHPGRENLLGKPRLLPVHVVVVRGGEDGGGGGGGDVDGRLVVVVVPVETGRLEGLDR